MAVLASPQDAAAQARWSVIATSNDWNTDANWDNFAVPGDFDSAAIVGSNTAGAEPNAVVVVSGTLTTPTVQISEGAGTSGEVTIGAGQSLSSVSNNFGGSNGDFFIGGTEGRPRGAQCRRDAQRRA